MQHETPPEKTEIIEIYSPSRIYWQLETPLAEKLSKAYVVNIVYYLRPDYNRHAHFLTSYSSGFVFLMTDGLVKAVNQICAENKLFYTVRKVTENRFEDPDWLETNNYRKT
jgi:hypothetical protein